MAEFSLDNARYMINACIEAYKDESEIDLSPLNLTMVRYFSDDRTDTQVYIAKDDSRIIVAFRGTSSTKDIMTDLKVVKEPFPPTRRWFFKPRAHIGFLESYKSVDDEIKASVKKLLEEGPRTIHTTGHSLGGALAHLCAIDLHTSLNVPVSVYSFGAPRVGNRWFRRMYNGKMVDSWRVVNDEDVIPNIPTKIMGYKHINHMALIDEGSIIYTNPSKDKVREKEIEGWEGALEEGLKDHASANYKMLLDKINDVLDIGVTGHE